MNMTKGWGIRKQSTCNKNNNVKILDIYIIFYERADNIFSIYYNHFNIVFNYDSTSGMLLSQNYKGYKETFKNFKGTIQLKYEYLIKNYFNLDKAITHFVFLLN